MRTQFLFSVLIACVVGSLTWMIHIISESYFIELKNYIINLGLFKVLLYSSIIVNLYESCVHFLTVLKFIRVKTYIPYGSRDNQYLISFLVWNTLDIIGWELMFICNIPQQIEYKIIFFWYPALLASMHIISEFTSAVFYPMFKTYFIDLDSDKKITIPSEKHWFRFRTTFIFLDAVTRTYMTMYIIYIHH